MLVLLRYTRRQLQRGQIVSIFVKNETTVLHLLRGNTASWLPELGVYAVDENSSDSEFICKHLDQLNGYYPLPSYHRGARSLLPLKACERSRS